jgi:hypothetical protein
MVVMVVVILMMVMMVMMVVMTMPARGGLGEWARQGQSADAGRDHRREGEADHAASR